MLYAEDFGAVFDGVTDDSAALQSAINEAAALGIPLALPGRTALIKTALDLKGRSVEIYGTINKTVLNAGTSGMTMIDIEEEDDVVYSPFVLSGITLDAKGIANFCIRIRFRHHSEMRGMYFIDAAIANVWEKDTWISRRYNCRTAAGPIGWQLEGSNFDSVYIGCYAVGCTDKLWLVNNNGSLLNGNNSLRMINCAATDASGIGIYVSSPGITINFESCYVGENLTTTTVVNHGGVLVFNGGTISHGYTSQSYLAEPVAGEIVLQESVQINGQVFGSIGLLSKLTPQQIAAGAGTLRLDDVKAYVIPGGDQVIPGDPLGYGEQREVLVPRLGRLFQPVANNVTLQTTNPTANGLRVACTAVNGSNPILGLAAPMKTTYRVAEPGYLVLVYQSSKSLQVRIDAAILGTPHAIISFPPAADVLATHVKIDAVLPAITEGSVLDILMPGTTVGDYLEIRECFLADSTISNKGSAVMNRLFKC